jgi:hypothetical protein
MVMFSRLPIIRRCQVRPDFREIKGAGPTQNDCLRRMIGTAPVRSPNLDVKMKGQWTAHGAPSVVEPKL